MSGSLLPNITYASATQPLYASVSGGGGGGGSYPAVASFSSINVSSFTKTNSVFSSTVVTLLPANTSTLALQFPNSLAFAGMWSFTATVADATDPPKAAGAIFSVAASSNAGSGSNFFSYATVANNSNGLYNWSMFAPATANTPPEVYLGNPTGNNAAASIAWLQMG